MKKPRITDLSRTERAELFAQAGREAVEKSRCLGLPITGTKDGKIVRTYSDGREVVLKDLRQPLTATLVANLKASLADLEALWVKYQSSRQYEDPIYRFYHQSYKVFGLQDGTVEIVEALRSLLPGRQINSKFQTILDEGTGKEFELADNERWLDATRPIVEAFFHARFFLEMAIKYGKELDEPPTTMPSGWAALLYLFDLR